MLIERGYKSFHSTALRYYCLPKALTASQLQTRLEAVVIRPVRLSLATY